jgi:hypothetical protein
LYFSVTYGKSSKKVLPRTYGFHNQYSNEYYSTNIDHEYYMCGSTTVDIVLPFTSDLKCIIININRKKCSKEMEISIKRTDRT